MSNLPARKFERLPPHDIEAEMATLGAITLAGELGIAAELLKAADFYREAHQAIFAALQSLEGRGSAIDLVTLKDELDRAGKLVVAGDVPYLMQICDYTPTTSSLAHYAAIVADKAMRRRIIEGCAVSASLAYGEFDPRTTEPEPDAAQIAGKVEQIIFAATQGGPGRKGSNLGWQNPKALIASNLDRIEKMYHNGGGLPGISTGLRDLDEITNGLHPGDLSVWGARPSIGKTVLMLRFLRNIAMQRLGAANFSVETMADKLMDRLLAGEATINGWKLQRGLLSEDEWTRLTDASAKLYDLPLRIDDSTDITVADMKSRARRLASEMDLRFLAVDYMQIVTGSGSKQTDDSMRLKIGEIARGLKSIARELKIHVMALSQVNRAVENRPDKRPGMADLMESGQIEAEADLIATLYRPSYYERRDAPDTQGADTSPFVDEMEIIICKNREGPTGTVKVAFEKEFTRIVDMPTGDYNGYHA